MSKRAFPIPSLAVIGLTLTTGCAPGVIGEWELVELNGDDIEQSESYGACTVTAAVEMVLTVEEKDGDTYVGEVEWESSVSYSDGCATYGYTNDRSYSYDGDVEATSDDGREFEVEVDGDFDLELECELSEDGLELECEDEDGDEYLFERAD